MYVHKNYWDVLDKAKLVGKNLCQGRFDYKTGGIFYGLLLAPKIKYCLTIDEFGIMQEQNTFIGFNDSKDSKRLIDRSQYFEVIEAKNLSAMLPKSWKKPFNRGGVIPTRKTFCIECSKKFAIEILFKLTKTKNSELI